MFSANYIGIERGAGVSCAITITFTVATMSVLLQRLLQSVDPMLQFSNQFGGDRLSVSHKVTSFLLSNEI
jgi:hypothetical protein